MRGKKTSEEDKEKVKALLYLHPEMDKADIARQSGVPRTTIIEMMKDEHFIDKDKFDEYRQQKKYAFIDKAWELISKTLQATEQKLDNLIDSPESLAKVNVRDIAITMGTIYDKQALASGEPTQISESRKPLPELVKDTEKMLAELKQLTGS